MIAWINKFHMVVWEKETKLDRVKRFLVSGAYTKTTYYLYDGLLSETKIGVWMILK